MPGRSFASRPPHLKRCTPRRVHGVRWLLDRRSRLYWAFYIVGSRPNGEGPASGGPTHARLEENQRRLAELVASYAGRKAQLAGINRLFEEALNSEADEDVAKTCLAVAEELTGSKFGLIGELNAEGRLDVVALSDPGWAACRMPKTNAVVLSKDMQLRGYLGQAVVDEKSVIVNDPAPIPAAWESPSEHVPIVAFLGVPLKRAGRTIGMIALVISRVAIRRPTNRPSRPSRRRLSRPWTANGWSWHKAKRGDLPATARKLDRRRADIHAGRNASLLQPQNP